MFSYILRRLLLMFPTLIGVTAVVFFIMALAPGGFTGVQMNEMGGQTEGDETRRLRNALERRYGLDSPVHIQYLRWLNRISPIGFTNSSELTFTEQQHAEARTILEQTGYFQSRSRIKAAEDLAISLAGYFDEMPSESAKYLAESLNEPVEGLAVFDRIDPDIREEMAESPNESDFEKELQAAAADDVSKARQQLFDRIFEEMEARNRLLVSWHRFGPKWPNLGESLKGIPVTEKLAATLPITMLLNVISIPIIYFIAIVSGIYAARRAGGWFDNLSGITFLVLWSIPPIFAGTVLIGFLADQQYIQLFPTSGYQSIEASDMPFMPTWHEGEFHRGLFLDVVWHLFLPIVCMVYGGFAVLSKLARGSVLENLSADYVRTARAKGVSESRILFGHAFKNSLLPLITVFASIFPVMLSGSVVVETIFSINGMGKLGIEAATQQDREVIMGVTLMASVVTLLSELLRDILYAVVDPRVSYE